jgi:uncharacterized protein (UPF0216 family)
LTKRKNLIANGDAIISAQPLSPELCENALAEYLNAGINSVCEEWECKIIGKAMSIIEYDFDNDGNNEILVGTDLGYLYAFAYNGTPKKVFTEYSNIQNVLKYKSAVNSIDVINNEDSCKLIIGSDKIYVLSFLNGVNNSHKNYKLPSELPISRLKVFGISGVNYLIVGDTIGGVYLYTLNYDIIELCSDFNFSTKSKVIDFAVGDVNGDGDNEIVVVSEDKQIYFLDTRAKSKAEPFPVKHWITNVDVDSKNGRLYIGEFDGTVHLYKYQKERIKQIAALKQQGILDLVVIHLLENTVEPQFIIGSSDKTLSIFDNINNDGKLLWAFSTGTGQRAITARIVPNNVVSLCVGTETCTLYKYSLLVDPDLIKNIKSVSSHLSYDELLNARFNRLQLDVLFNCIERDPIDKTASIATMQKFSTQSKWEVEFIKPTIEMWWNSVEYLWSVTVGGRVYAISTMSKIALVASQNPYLLALNLDDGSSVWKHSVSGGVRGVSVYTQHTEYDDTFIALATINNSLDCDIDKMFDNSLEVIKGNRTPSWGFKHKDWVLFVVSDDINCDGESEIIIGTEDKKILAFSSTGKLLWQREATERVRALSIADLFGDGKKYIIAGSDDTFVYIYDSNGVLFSKFSTPHYVLVIKAFDINNDGKCEILTGNEDGFLHVYDCSGTLIWQFETGSWVAALDVAVNIKTPDSIEIIIGSADKSIYGLNGYGRLLWQYETDARVRALTVVNNINSFASFDIMFGTYSNKDNIYKITHINQEHILAELENKYEIYRDNNDVKILKVEERLLTKTKNKNLNNRHIRAFFALFSSNENFLRECANDDSDLVLSAVGCAIVQRFFEIETLRDVLSDIMCNPNRKVRLPILLEMSKRCSEYPQVRERYYNFICRLLGKSLSRIHRIDIVRYGYLFSDSYGDIIRIADKIYVQGDEILTEELRYALQLANKKYRSYDENEPDVKQILNSWNKYFTH